MRDYERDYRYGTTGMYGTSDEDWQSRRFRDREREPFGANYRSFGSGVTPYSSEYYRSDRPRYGYGESDRGYYGGSYGQRDWDQNREGGGMWDRVKGEMREGWDRLRGSDRDDRDFRRDDELRWRERSDRGDRGERFWEETKREAREGWDRIKATFAGKGPKGYARSDDRIKEDVCERLYWHPEVDASEIEVTVKSGEVMLAGKVPDRRSKRLAEDVAENVTGVRDVSNGLRVDRNIGGYTETTPTRAGIGNGDQVTTSRNASR